MGAQRKKGRGREETPQIPGLYGSHIVRHGFGSVKINSHSREKDSIEQGLD